MDGNNRRGFRSIMSTMTLCAVAACGGLALASMSGCEWMNPTVKNPDNPDAPRMTQEQFRDWYAQKKQEDERKAAAAAEVAKERMEAEAARVKREAEEDAERERLRLEAERRAFENAVANIEGDCALKIREASAGFENLKDQVGAAIRRIETKGIEGMELVNRKHAEALRAADEERRAALAEHGRVYGAGKAYFEQKAAEFGMVDSIVRAGTESPLVNLVPWGGAAALAVSNVWQALSGARRRREDEKKAAEAKLLAEQRIAEERIEKAKAMAEAEKRVREEADKAWDASKEEHEKAVVKRDADYVEGVGAAKADAMAGALMTLLASFVPAPAKAATT